MGTDAPDAGSAVLGCSASADFEDNDSCTAQTWGGKVLLGWPNEKADTRGFHVSAVKAAQGIGGYNFNCVNREADSADCDSNGDFYESSAACYKGETMTDCNGYIDEQIDECGGAKGAMHEFYGF